jgi:hypothetical protein
VGMLRDRMAEDLRLRGLAPISQTHYLRCAQRFADFYSGRSPLKLVEVQRRLSKPSTDCPGSNNGIFRWLGFDKRYPFLQRSGR